MTFLEDPGWLAHRYDPDHDSIHLAEVTRDQRRNAPFLTDEHLAPVELRIVSRPTLEAVRLDHQTHFVFHSAFCCSTLLSNALDVPGVASVFKEPVILNDIVGWMHRGAQGQSVVRALNSSLRMLTPFEKREAAIIKPSNVVNGLAVAAMGLRPKSRAILLFAPLRQYLTSIARKGMWGRLWARDLLAKQVTEGFVDLGFADREYFLLTDIQAAAVGWLAQQSLFQKMQSKFPSRVLMLNSETFVEDSVGTLSTVLNFLRLELGDVAIAERVRSTVSRDSKDGSRFAAGKRAAVAAHGYQLHADEIEKVAEWARVVAAGAGIAIEPTGSEGIVR